MGLFEVFKNMEFFGFFPYTIKPIISGFGFGFRLIFDVDINSYKLGVKC